MNNSLITLSMKDIQRYDIIQKLINKQINGSEAAKMIGVSIRQVKRIKATVISHGAHGVAHKSRGKPSNRKHSDEFIDNLISIIKDSYHDFKPTFAAEKLMENHGIKIGRESLRVLMTKYKLWNPKQRKLPKNNKYWRKRKDNYGEMQQFDGSYHLWLELRNGGVELCLLLAVDDATGEITYAKFDVNEGTVAVFKFWKEYMEQNGLPVSIYLDKFSTYKINHPAAVNNKDLMTQFQRACNQIGINLISANSPQAKGRVERMNGTLQDRLIKEMRLANICTTEEANEFLKEFIPKYNKQFGVVPSNQSNLHKPLRKELKDNLNQILSIQDTRKVNNDLTISYKSNIYLLDKNQSIGIYKKEIVTVEEHLNGEIRISYKDHYLNYTKLSERPKKQKYIPVQVDKRGTINKPSANHPWRRTLYGSSIEQKQAELSRNEKFEELKKNNQLNLDINKVAIKR